MLNKPRGYLTTARDDRGRRTIADLLQEIPERLVHVGRLDRDSEGLLLLTNDGELAHRLMHPAHSVEKEYETWVEGRPQQGALQCLERGVEVEGRLTRPARVRVVGTEVGNGAPVTRLLITITEGRKRQVRLMCRAVGHPVVRLRRVREGTPDPGEPSRRPGPVPDDRRNCCASLRCRPLLSPPAPAIETLIVSGKGGRILRTMGVSGKVFEGP